MLGDETMKKYDKTICIGIFLMQGIVMPGIAQTGINTYSPAATLDVQSGVDLKAEGVIAPRLSGADLVARDDFYNAVQNGVIVYVTEPLALTATTSRTLNVLEKGYYYFDAEKGNSGQWVQMFDSEPQIITGANTGNAYTGNGITLQSSNGSAASQSMITKTFTLLHRSMVSISFSVPVSQFVAANGGVITDGLARLYTTNIYMSGGNLPSNWIFTRGANSYTTAGSGSMNGVFQLSSTRSVVLEAGTYTADMVVGVSSNNSAGVRATFGLQTDTVFDIIAVPLAY